MDYSKFRRSEKVDDETAAFYTLMTILRNPLRSQYIGDWDPNFPGGRYQEQPQAQHMGQMRTFPDPGTPRGSLSEQAGLSDLERQALALALLQKDKGNENGR